MNPIEVLAIAKKFTKDTAIQFGAVKGAPCVVSGAKYDSDGNTVITLAWQNDDGERRTRDITIQKGIDGGDGISIVSVELNEDNHLIITYSDHTTTDAGLVDTTETLSNDLIATVDIGSVTNGRKYLKGTPLETIIRDMLIKTEKPTVSLSTTPDKTVYDVVTEKITSIKLSAKAVKKTYDIAKIEFFEDSKLISTVTVGVISGGTFDFNYTPDTPINKTTVFKAVVTDIKGNSNQSTITISFVGNSYYGFVEPDVGEPSEALIKVLNKKLKTTKGYVYSNITCPYNKIVYAYPVSFGALTSIKDMPNNINYTASFTRTSVTVDGIMYYVYTQTDPSGADGVELTFA